MTETPDTPSPEAPTVDDPSPVPGTDRPDTDGPRLQITGSRTRHLIVLGILTLVCALGLFLVATGGDDSEPTSITAAASTTVLSTPLRSLGSFTSVDTARSALTALDPETLEPPTSADTTITSTPTTVPGGTSTRLTEASVRRCQPTLGQQTTDGDLGDPVTSASLVIDGVTYLVTAHHLDPDGAGAPVTRLVVFDATSCQISFAVDP